MSDDYMKFDGRREEPPYAGNVDEWGPIVEQLEDRIRALESLARAADRMREGGSAALDMTKEWHGGLCSCRKCKVRDELGLSINDYDTQRAAVGELGEE